MRIVIALLMLVTPALADDWTGYANMRFGVNIDVPPGWQRQPDPVNGDGRTWYSGDWTSSLMAWGSNLGGDFKSDFESRLATDMDIGWTITYKQSAKLASSKTGDAWYVYSGTLNNRVLYQKAMASCRGRQAIYVRIEYPADQRGKMQPVVARLAKSLRAGVALDCKSG